MSKDQSTDYRRHEVKRGGSFVVERDGAQVSFIVQCDDEYAAIALYDDAIARAHRGDFQLNLVLNGVAREH